MMDLMAKIGIGVFVSQLLAVGVPFLLSRLDDGPGRGAWSLMLIYTVPICAIAGAVFGALAWAFGKI